MQVMKSTIISPNGIGAKSWKWSQMFPLTSRWYFTFEFFLRSNYLFYTYLSVISASCFFSISFILKHFKWSPNKWKFSKQIELPQLSLSLCIYFGPLLGKMSEQFLYRYQLTYINISSYLVRSDTAKI